MNLGKAIKSVRRQLGITQYELAEICQISQTSLSQIETGVKRPSQRTMKKICAAFEIPESVLYILGMQDTDVPASKRDIYAMLFPSIQSLALQMVSSEHSKLLEGELVS